MTYFYFQLNKSEEELRCESDKVRRAMTTAEKVKEETSDLSSELSGRDSEITLLKANEKRLVRDLAGICNLQLHYYTEVEVLMERRPQPPKEPFN